MIITAMDNWNPAPGTLLEWHPRVDVRPLIDGADVDPTPPTFLQENHVRGVDAARLRGDTHHGYLGAATEIAGDLDTGALTRALEAFVLRHGGLQTSFDVADGVVRRRRVPCDAVMFEVVTVAETTGSTQFLDYARARFAREATPLSWPGFSFGAVARPGSFTLYYGVDHAFSDGASQVLVVSELADLYRAESTGTPAADISAWTGSFLDYVGIEDRAATEFSTESPEIRGWSQLVSANGGAMPSFPLDLGLAAGESAPVHPIELFLLDPVETASFDEVCRRAGVKFVSGVLAAVAITDLEVAGRENYFGLTVLSTRHLGDFALSQGWFCNFAPVSFDVGGAPDFATVARRAHDGYREAKSLAAAPIGTVLRLLVENGVAGPGIAASPHMLSYIDFRWFPGHGTPADDDAILFTGQGRTANASMWFNRDADHFYLGSQTPNTPYAQHQIARYHAHLKHVLRTVACEGEYRPGAARRPEGEQEPVRVRHQH